MQATSQNANTGCSSVDTINKMSHSPSPPDVSKEGDEQNEPHQQILQKQANSQWSLPSQPGKCRVHDYTRGPTANSNKPPYINESYSPIIVFSFFVEIITLPVAKTNQWYHHYLDTPDNGLPPASHMTKYEMFVFWS